MKTALAAIAVSLLSGAAFGATVLSENFNSVTPATYTSGSTVGVFTVNANSVDVVGPGFYPELCVGVEAGNCVDLSGDNNGTISTALLALAPGLYTLTFDLNGTQRGFPASATATVGGLFSETFAFTSSETHTITRNFTVASPTSAALGFQSNTPGVYGLLLDNVLLTSQPAGVPEPATGTLLGAAVLALVGLRKFSRKASHRVTNIDS